MYVDLSTLQSTYLLAISCWWEIGMNILKLHNLYWVREGIYLNGREG